MVGGVIDWDNIEGRCEGGAGGTPVGASPVVAREGRSESGSGTRRPEGGGARGGVWREMRGREVDKDVGRDSVSRKLTNSCERDAPCVCVYVCVCACMCVSLERETRIEKECQAATNYGSLRDIPSQMK